MNGTETDISDSDWLRLVKEGKDEGWKLVWERVVEPESQSMRSREPMARYSRPVISFLKRRVFITNSRTRLALVRICP